MSHRPCKANRPKKIMRDFVLLTNLLGLNNSFYFDALPDEVAFDKSLSQVIVHLDAVSGQPWSSRCQQETSLCRRLRLPLPKCWVWALINEDEKLFFRRKSIWDLSQIWIKMGLLRYNTMIMYHNWSKKKYNLNCEKVIYEKIYNTYYYSFEMWQGDA